MEFNIVCVGNIKEKFYTDAINEYKKRICAFATVNIIEVKEADYSVGITKAKRKEADLLSKFKKGFCVALAINGKSFNSEVLASKIKNLSVKGVSCISLFIGGSYGLDEEFINNADFALSFSEFTFPHQLMRVILLEQIYRSCCINAGKTYHK